MIEEDSQRYLKFGLSSQHQSCRRVDAERATVIHKDLQYSRRFSRNQHRAISQPIQLCLLRDFRFQLAAQRLQIDGQLLSSTSPYARPRQGLSIAVELHQQVSIGGCNDTWPSVCMSPPIRPIASWARLLHKVPPIMFQIIQTGQLLGASCLS
jgi:hypothetical protein